VDVLALGSMKTAAKRDIQWELQKHETHQVVERICGSGLPEPTSVRVSLTNLIPSGRLFLGIKDLVVDLAVAYS
jgi:hypothetical protein